MFKNYGEKKFKKQFPQLKQVINGNEVDFDMYGQVPLKMGENSVYLKDQEGKNSVHTYFEVDPYHKYGLKIEMNYAYVMTKIKTQLILVLVIGFIASMLIQIVLASLGWLSLVISFAFILAVYLLGVNRLVAKLGISAYKVEVVSNKL